ncbi:MAG: CHAP domain-containing protein [Nocardioides sp.]
MTNSSPRHRLAQPTRPSARRFVTLLAVLLLAVPVGSAVADEAKVPPDSSTNPTGPSGQKKPTTPVWAGYPGTNAAHDSYAYAWPAAPDCDESNVATGGCVNDGLGFFQGQCTSWVAHRLNQRNGLPFSNWYAGVHWGNAADWAAVARSNGIKPNEVPGVGSVGWYARGHVSYVEEVNVDGSIVISEMNTDGHNAFHLVTVRAGGPGWPDKFIHLADVVPVDYTAPDAPPALTATAGRAAVELTWEPAADDVGTTGYSVARNGIQVATTPTPSYLDRQASPDQGYTYSVEAYDAAGNLSGASTTLLRPGAAAPDRLGRPFLPGSARLVALDDRDLVCGRLGTVRDQRIGCLLRTPDGPRLVRTGREVPWGSGESQAFLAGADDRAWFCRFLSAGAGSHACVPFDPASGSWGFDRVQRADGAELTDVSWVAAPSGPARCGLVTDRATCAVVTDAGWSGPQRAHDARPGDPLSRAFVPTARGIGFCRVVEGRAACTELRPERRWRHDVVRGQGVEHGRWVARRTGPALCPVGGGECRPVTLHR